MQHLTLPFAPSPLSIPLPPFSLLSPLSPLAFQTRCSRNTPTAQKSTAPPLPPPLQWQWTCHVCSRTYPLGTTRRCLEDGHFFCAGTTSVTKSRSGTRRKRGRACMSEFDYIGWKNWGRWKRAVTTSEHYMREEIQKGCVTNTTEKRVNTPAVVKRTQNCWRECDSPSQCRWGKTIGIHTPSPSPTRTEFTLPSLQTSMPSPSIGGLPTLDECFLLSPPGFERGTQYPPTKPSTTNVSISQSSNSTPAYPALETLELDADTITASTSTFTAPPTPNASEPPRSPSTTHSLLSKSTTSRYLAPALSITTAISAATNTDSTQRSMQRGNRQKEGRGCTPQSVPCLCRVGVGGVFFEGAVVRAGVEV